MQPAATTGEDNPQKEIGSSHAYPDIIPLSSITALSTSAVSLGGDSLMTPGESLLNSSNQSHLEEPFAATKAINLHLCCRLSAVEGLDDLEEMPPLTLPPAVCQPEPFWDPSPCVDTSEEEEENGPHPTPKDSVHKFLHRDHRRTPVQPDASLRIVPPAFVIVACLLDMFLALAGLDLFLHAAGASTRKLINSVPPLRWILFRVLQWAHSTRTLERAAVGLHYLFLQESDATALSGLGPCTHAALVFAPPTLNAGVIGTGRQAPVLVPILDVVEPTTLCLTEEGSSHVMSGLARSKRELRKPKN